MAKSDRRMDVGVSLSHGWLRATAAGMLVCPKNRHPREIGEPEISSVQLDFQYCLDDLGIKVYPKIRHPREIGEPEPLPPRAVILHICQSNL